MLDGDAILARPFRLNQERPGGAAATGHRLGEVMVRALREEGGW